MGQITNAKITTSSNRTNRNLIINLIFDLNSSLIKFSNKFNTNMKLLIISLLSIFSYAQIKTEFLYEFGEFSNASSFTISSNGLIYITDANKNEILCYDTLGNKLKDAGGFGWQNGLFDNPIDIFANPLAIYVADKNNHRIQQFDRNLNFIASYSYRNEENTEKSFGFPLSVVISNQGDLFILDGENTRVIKFDLFGNFISSFAGLDAGKFRLKKPSSMALNSLGFLFVADDKNLNIYDSYGNGLNILTFDSAIKSIRVIFDYHIVVTKKAIINLQFKQDKFSFNSIDIPDLNLSKVNSAFIFNNKLYILLFNKIVVYKLVN